MKTGERKRKRKKLELRRHGHGTWAAGRNHHDGPPGDIVLGIIVDNNPHACTVGAGAELDVGALG